MQESLGKGWKITIGFLCYATCLMELLRRMDFRYAPEIYQILLWSDCVCGGIVVSRMRLWKNKWALPQLLFFPLVILLNCVQGFGAVWGEEATLLRAVYLFCLMGLLGAVYQKDEMKTWLKGFVASWTIVYLAFSIIGLWACLNGTKFPNFSGSNSAGLEYGRLWIYAYCTVNALELCVSVVMAYIGAVLFRNCICKILFIFASIPMMVALALTDGRAGIFCLGGGIGLLAAVLLFYGLEKKNRKMSGLLKTIASLVVVGVCTAVVYIGVTGLVPLANQAINAEHHPELLATSFAEEAATAPVDTAAAEPVKQPKPNAIHRGDQQDFFTGRVRIWNAGVQLLKDHPSVFLLGASIPLVDELFSEYAPEAGFAFEHMHNLALQILMELGALGLLLFIAFLVFFCWNAWKLMLTDHFPLWIRVLPIPAMCILVIEFVECITKISFRYPGGGVLMLFAGITMAYGSAVKKEKMQVKP